jgi:hypothetical protein
MPLLNKGITLLEKKEFLLTNQKISLVIILDLVQKENLDQKVLITINQNQNQKPGIQIQDQIRYRNL